MPFNKWFKGSGSRSREPESLEPTIEDLIVLERYDEAEARLKLRLKDNPRDLHAHLKLAEVYIELKQGPKAVEEYIFVAEEHARDGFYDKGIALLSKVLRLAPTDESLRLKIEALQQAKRLEHKREFALDGFKDRPVQGPGGTSTVPLQRLWTSLARSEIIQRLPGEQLKRFFAAAELLEAEEGELLGKAGEPGSELLFLARGVVEAIGELSDGTPRSLRSFGSGDILGESVLFERKPWPADYRVTEPATYFRLSRSGLEKTLVGNPDPRGFLDVLRNQQNDRDVDNILRRLRAKG